MHVFLPVVNVVPFVCFPRFVVRVVAVAMYRGLDTARRTAQPCLSPWKQATRTLGSSSTSTSISPNLSVLWVEFFRDCLLSFFSLFFFFLAKHSVVGHLFVQVNRSEILFLAVPKRFSSSGRWAKLGLQYELPQRKSSLVGQLVHPILLVSDGANQWWNQWRVEGEEKWFVALKKISEMMHLVLLFVLLTAFSSQKGKAYFLKFIFLLLDLCSCSVFCFCFCPLPCHLN